MSQQIISKSPVPWKIFLIRIIFNSHLEEKSRNTGIQSRFFSGEPASTWEESELELSLLHSGIILSLMALSLVSHCFHPLLLYQHIQKRQCSCASWDHPLGGRAWSKGARLGKFCTTTVPQSEGTNQSQLVTRCFFSAQFFYDIKNTAGLILILKNY